MAIQLYTYKLRSVLNITPEAIEYLCIEILNKHSKKLILHLSYRPLQGNTKLSENIVIRNGRIVWKQGTYCWYFEADFETALATFCCYDHGAIAFEAVQEIATDQKRYRICSSCVIICWIAKIYLSVNDSEKRLVTRTPPT